MREPEESQTLVMSTKVSLDLRYTPPGKLASVTHLLVHETLCSMYALSCDAYRAQVLVIQGYPSLAQRTVQ